MMRTNYALELDRWFAFLRDHGRVMKLGVPVAPPSLPRSRRLRRMLEQEAASDHRVRVALDAGLAAEQETRLSKDRGSIHIH